MARSRPQSPKINPLRAAACLLLAASSASADRTLLVGIRTYPGAPQVSVPRYSDRDADAVRRWLATALAQNVMPLQNADASFDRMTLELRTVLLGARPGEAVYLFISARGLAGPRTRNGFIETAGIRENKPESTAISLIDLADLIRQSPASRVFFLADLCRDEGSTVDNRINERIQEHLGSIPKVRGILASSGSQTSREDSLPSIGSIPAGGYGFFAYSFVRSLVENKTDFSAVFDSVSKEVAERSSGAQRPALLGTRETFPLWAGARRGAILNPSRLALFFFQTPQPQTTAPLSPEDQSTLDNNLARAADLLRQGRFDDFVALARAAQSTSPPPLWTVLRDRLAVATADIGQAVVARYGASDLLPDDPEKTTEVDFLRAGRAFDAALAILAAAPLSPDEERILGAYRASLDARRLFVQGRAAAFHPDRLSIARDLLERAEAAAAPRIPEISNALGITYLEFPSAGPARRIDDLRTAIRHFQRASSLSPSWSYPRHNLALAYLQLGDSASARRAYLEAASASPDLPYLYFNLGLVQQRRNELKEAQRSYRNALDLGRKIELSLNDRAVEWQAILPDDAKLATQRAAVFHRNQAQVYNALGTLYEAQQVGADEAKQRAAGQYLLAIKYDPTLAAAKFNLGLLHASQSRYGDAALLLEAVVTAQPKDLLARLRLAEIYLRTRKFDEAEKAYRAILACAGGTHFEARKGLAETLAAQTNPNVNAAIEEMNAAIAEQIRYRTAGMKATGKHRLLAGPSYYEVLGRMYQRAGNPEAACTQFQIGREASKQSPHEAAAGLKELLKTCPGKRSR